MNGLLLCSLLGWTSLIASWGIRCFKFENENTRNVIGLILASFSVGIFTATIILRQYISIYGRGDVGKVRKADLRMLIKLNKNKSYGYQRTML